MGTNNKICLKKENGWVDPQMARSIIAAWRVLSDKESIIWEYCISWFLDLTEHAQVQHSWSSLAQQTRDIHDSPNADIFHFNLIWDTEIWLLYYCDYIYWKPTGRWADPKNFIALSVLDQKL